MSEPVNTLLIDMGNSRTKCCYSIQGELQSFFYLQHPCDLEDKLSRVSRCVISSVGQSQYLTQIRQLLERHNISEQLVATPSQQLGLKNGYAEPARLGSDRWLAMLACQPLFKGCFAVLDFGTAMTCDFVDDRGQHLGGWIAPGISTMKDALLQKTENVAVKKQNPGLLQIGKNTSDGVNNGCLAATQGFLLAAIEVIKGISADYRIFIAGGDAQQFEKFMDEKIVSIENPVLMGMNRLISD